MRLDLSSLVMLVDILSNVGLWSLTQMIQSNPSHCETTTKTYNYELRQKKKLEKTLAICFTNSTSSDLFGLIFTWVWVNTRDNSCCNTSIRSCKEKHDKKFWKIMNSGFLPVIGSFSNQKFADFFKYLRCVKYYFWWLVHHNMTFSRQRL